MQDIPNQQSKVGAAVAPVIRPAPDRVTPAVAKTIHATAHTMASGPRFKGKTPSLFIDLAPLRPGVRLGPELPGHAAPIVVQRPSVLVFVDPEPTANFGHDCHYWFFDPQSGHHLPALDVQARFPPYVRGVRPAYRPLEGPARASPAPRGAQAFKTASPVEPATVATVEPQGWLSRIVQLLRQLLGLALPPIPVPSPVLAAAPRKKHAILFAGNPDVAHINDMEFCYRMLVDKFGFDRRNVHVLNYNGKLTTWEWQYLPPPKPWPGKYAPGGGSGYRLQQHPGIRRATREQMRAVLRVLKGKMQAEDLLFIYVTGHGGNTVINGSATGESFLNTPASYSTYGASEFAADLAVLGEIPGGKFRHLMVMMQQCASGGFKDPVLNCGCAEHTSFASAATSTARSYKTPDLLWNQFSRNWFAAFMSSDPSGSAPVHKVDGAVPGQAADGKVGALEGFFYASRSGISHLRDSPQYASRSPAVQPSATVPAAQAPSKEADKIGFD
jgi:hypothetical protein